MAKSDEQRSSSKARAEHDGAEAEGPLAERSAGWLAEVIASGSRSRELALALAGLSPRERKVIEMRYGLDSHGKRSVTDTARACRTTIRRVGEIELETVAKLRMLLELICDATDRARTAPGGAGAKADSVPVAKLHLSRHAENALYRDAIRSVGQLRSMLANDGLARLLALRDVGTGAAWEIVRALAALDSPLQDRAAGRAQACDQVGVQPVPARGVRMVRPYGGAALLRVRQDWPAPRA